LLIGMFKRLIEDLVSLSFEGLSMAIIVFYAYNRGRKCVHSVMEHWTVSHESLKTSLSLHALLSPYLGLSFSPLFRTFSSASD
jgi:hypothetical protein